MKNNKFYLFIFFLFILFLSLCKIYNYKIFQDIISIFFNKKKILIEIDISRVKARRGPGIFVNGIKDILPYNTSQCDFIPSESIYPNNKKSKSNFFFIPNAFFLKESIYNKWINTNTINKLILGPIFVPEKWNYFPIKNNWKEKHFYEILKSVRGIAVHSVRVRNHLMYRTNTLNMIKKFLIIRPCTNLIPKNLKPFNKRKIDILFFEKYADLDRRIQANHLLKLFINTSKNIKILKYGNYKKKEILKIANNSKFIIYFSFFDTGAIALKEIQNYGVFAFSHQKDLIIDRETSFFIPELAFKNNMKFAFLKIMKLIKKITNSNPNTILISEKNMQINKCKNTLNDLCKSLL